MAVATIASILTTTTARTSSTVVSTTTTTAPTTEDVVTDFSLLDDAGNQVLGFGAAAHGRRLDSTKEIHLTFQASGKKIKLDLHRSPSMITSDTKTYAYDKQGNYLEFDVPEEPRSFTTKDNHAGLTFLSHNKIHGVVLLPKRYV